MSRFSQGPLSLLVVVTAIAAVAAGAFMTPAAAKGYTPPAGVQTNNPLGDREHRRAIISQIIRTIDSTPRKGEIRIASWNVRSDAIVDALIRAHKRHVSVRLILDRGNADHDNPNSGIDRLQRALARFGNQTRRPSLRSRLKKCRGSCRGKRGIAHSKFYLFKKAGNARYIVMNGSANATDLAASSQWNDLYTVRGKAKIYREFRAVFNEMMRDRPVRQGYRVARFDSLTTMFFPYAGQNTAIDPVLRELNRTRCSGAKNGVNGHTEIRIAMTAWFGDRGKDIATKVRRMQNQGCHIRIVYAVMGNEVLRILRHGGPHPVPRRHIVQDFNRDGVYDRYLHMKVLTINGVYGGDDRAWVTINGSANWSPAALASDEALMRIKGKGVVRRYNRWINYLFHHPPRNPRPDLAARRAISAGAVDPYSKIQVD